MKVEFVDLNRQIFGDKGSAYSGIIKEIRASLEHCIKNTSFIMGNPLEKFEQEFADYCGAKYCIGLNSGTDALEFALRCTDLISGNVITVPNSYFSTSSSISQAGLRPKFVDVDPKSSNLNIGQLEKAIDKETKAILPVHMYGRPCEITEILKIAKKYNLKVIEDCAHSPGAKYQNKKVGTFGDVGCFSFFPGKNIGAFGDAGALITDNPEVARKARLWRNDGSLEKYNHEIVGRKARMDTIQASILSVKLPYLDNWNELRKKNAKLYNELLKDIEEIQLPLLDSNEIDSVFHIYSIFTDKREDLKKYLIGNDIMVGIHYPVSIHLQPAYNNLGYKIGDFPISEKLAKKELSLPMFPELRRDEIEFICQKIKDFYGAGN